LWGVHGTNKKKRLGVGVGLRFLGLNQFLLGSKLTPCSMFCAKGQLISKTIYGVLDSPKK